MRSTRENRGLDQALLASIESQVGSADLPEPTAKPCAECPWRKDSVSGHLGPHTAQEWLEIANQDGPIACHMTIERDGQPWEELRQCAGSAQFRTNICKTPRWNQVAIANEVDTTVVFGSSREFLTHHEENL